MSVNPKIIEPILLAGGDVGCLMIHGFTSCPADIRPLSKHLHSLGFTVHELLLPGHGTSYEDMVRYSWSDWIFAVETGLKSLLALCSKVWVVGSSMGGTLAALAASKYPVEGLVSIAAPIWPRPKRTRYAFILKYFQKYAQLGQRPQYKFPSWRYQQVAVKNIADLMHLIKLGKRALPRIKVPALVVQGDDDRTIMPKSANYIYDSLGSTDKELVFFSGGHMLLLEKGSKDVSKCISEFILFRTGGSYLGCCKTGY